VVILTVKAVKRTGIIKDCQVLVSIFRSVGYGISRVPATGPCGTDKAAHAVGGKWIIIVI
jgi:hypothetical protein